MIAALDDDCECCDPPTCPFVFCGRPWPAVLYMTVTATDASTGCLQDVVVEVRYYGLYMGYPFWRGAFPPVAGLNPDPLYVWLYLCNDVDLNGGAYGFLDARSTPPDPPGPPYWYASAYGAIVHPPSAPNIGDWLLSCDPLAWVGRWTASAGGSTPVGVPCSVGGILPYMDLLFTEDAP